MKEWMGADLSGLDIMVVILNTGGMNDGVQQQTQRIDENMPFLALDQFARIKSVRCAPPLYGVFFVKRFQSGASFFVRAGAGFFAPTRSIAKPARAGGVKVGRRANLAAYSGLAGHTLTASSTTARLVRSG
jgi:hypothetical protein